MRPSNSAFDSLYCNLLSKPNFEVEEENSLSTRAWCTKRLCSLTAVLLLSNIYPSRQETPNLIGKKKKTPLRGMTRKLHQKKPKGYAYMQGHIYALACCWRSTLPQADTTLKHNITCHSPSVPATLFIKGSKRD